MTLAEAQQVVGRRLYGANWIGRLPARVSWILKRRAASKTIIVAKDEEIATAEDLLLRLASQYQHVHDWLVEHGLSRDLTGTVTDTASWDVDLIALSRALAFDPDMLPEAANDLAVGDHGPAPAAAASMEPKPCAETTKRRRRIDERRPDIAKASRALWRRGGRLDFKLPWKDPCREIEKHLNWPEGECKEYTLRRAIADLKSGNL